MLGITKNIRIRPRKNMFLIEEIDTVIVQNPMEYCPIKNHYWKEKLYSTSKGIKTWYRLQMIW